MLKNQLQTLALLIAFNRPDNTQKVKGKGAQNHWLEIFRKVYDGHRKDIWDYQWLCAIWLNRGLAIIPNVNLVSNIGLDPDATHTNTPDLAITNIRTEGLHFPLILPTTIEADKQADAFTLSTLFRKSETVGKRIKKHIGHFIPHQIKKIIRGIL